MRQNAPSRTDKADGPTTAHIHPYTHICTHIQIYRHTYAHSHIYPISHWDAILKISPNLTYLSTLYVLFYCSARMQFLRLRIISKNVCWVPK